MLRNTNDYEYVPFIKFVLSMKEIEIPFGAKDSELKGWEYTIPEGMEAEIKDGKIVVREKEPELTEFERELALIIDTWMKSPETRIPKYVLEHSSRLLELAKKEICKECTVGLDQYWKGRKDAREEYEKPYTYLFYKPCHFGGICNNPMRDCLNCPMHSTGLNTTTTTSGTCKKED